MKKPIKGSTPKELKEYITKIEDEIDAVKLITGNMTVTELSHELIALDYQRSLLKKGERLYHSKPFSDMSNKDKEREWVVLNPETDEYQDVKLIDMVEKGDQLTLWD